MLVLVREYNVSTLTLRWVNPLRTCWH